MSKLSFRIKKEKLKDIIERYGTHFDEDVIDWVLDSIKQHAYQENMDINMKDLPTTFAVAMFQLSEKGDIDLGPTQLKVLRAITGALDGDSILDTKIKSPRGLYNNLILLNPNHQFNFIYELMGREIPLKVDFDMTSSWYSDQKELTVNASIEIGKGLFYPVIRRAFTRSDLFDEILDGVDTPIYATVGDFLEKLGLDPEVDMFDMDGYLELCDQARKIAKPGNMFEVNATVITFYTYTWWKSLEFTDINSEVITEPVLETKDDDNRGYGRSKETKGLPSPFVRVFSLSLKNYYFVMVDDLEEVEWDKDAMNKLVLPRHLSEMLVKMFNAKEADLATDLVKGNAGGLIMLASGGPGTGKTATAIAYSQSVRKPLYIMEVSELGTSPSSIEERLQKIFIRVQRWNAVLLMDEVDIFFAKRDLDLERSAMVGVFLRVLDQFKGMLFLTTNRPEVIDPAFRSRITVHLKYPDLGHRARLEIWKAFVKLAKLKLSEPGKLSEIANLELNGREIRNKARILKVLFDGNPITTKEIQDVIENTQ